MCNINPILALCNIDNDSFKAQNPLLWVAYRYLRSKLFPRFSKLEICTVARTFWSDTRIDIHSDSIHVIICSNGKGAYRIWHGNNAPLIVEAKDPQCFNKMIKLIIDEFQIKYSM